MQHISQFSSVPVSGGDTSLQSLTATGLNNADIVYVAQMNSPNPDRRTTLGEIFNYILNRLMNPGPFTRLGPLTITQASFTDSIRGTNASYPGGIDLTLGAGSVVNLRLHGLTENSAQIQLFVYAPLTAPSITTHDCGIRLWGRNTGYDGELILAPAIFNVNNQGRAWWIDLIKFFSANFTHDYENSTYNNLRWTIEAPTLSGATNLVVPIGSLMTATIDSNVGYGFPSRRGGILGTYTNQSGTFTAYLSTDGASFSSPSLPVVIKTVQGGPENLPTSYRWIGTWMQLSPGLVIRIA